MNSTNPLPTKVVGNLPIELPTLVRHLIACSLAISEVVKLKWQNSMAKLEWQNSMAKLEWRNDDLATLARRV